MNIPVETSARHVHLSQEHLEILFGKGHQLQMVRSLSQPGQYACVEKLTIIGSEVGGECKKIENVTILGPVREMTQVEISLTDARNLRLDVPIRESGFLKGSGCCVLKGPRGSVELNEGVIIAKRHIHMTPEDAKNLKVKNGDIVSVGVVGDPDRDVIYCDVVVRVSSTARLAMHLDTDEANATGQNKQKYGQIIAGINCIDAYNRN